MKQCFLNFALFHEMSKVKICAFFALLLIFFYCSFRSEKSTNQVFLRVLPFFQLFCERKDVGFRASKHVACCSEQQINVAVDVCC